MNLPTQVWKFVARCLVASCLAASLTAHAASPGFTPGQAEVVKVTGAATYVDGAGKSGVVTVGMKFGPGVIISTPVEAVVELNLGVNGEKLLIKSDSTLAINELERDVTKTDAVVNTELEVKKGSIAGNVKKLSAASKYEVKTSKGVAGIRGTTFSVYANGTVTVWQGSLVMIYVVGGVQSQPVTVKAGEAASPPAKPGGVPLVINNPPPHREPPNQFELPPDAPPPVIFISPTTGTTP